jgi:hypothetical protein
MENPDAAHRSGFGARRFFCPVENPVENMCLRSEIHSRIHYNQPLKVDSSAPAFVENSFDVILNAAHEAPDLR